MKLLKTSTVLLALAAGLFFSCKKEAKPEQVICIFPAINYCIPVKYIGNGCEDVVQIQTDADINMLKPYLTQWRSNDGKTLFENTIGAGHLPTTYRDGNIFRIGISGIDSNKVTTMQCLPVKFSLKYSAIGKDKCVFDSTSFKQISTN